jgi:hypothetical protein
MADDEIRLRAIIEAEDRSKQVLDDAKKRTEDLAKLQVDLNARIAASQTQLANGQSKVNIKTSEYLGLVKQLDTAVKDAAKAQKEFEKAQADAIRAQDKSARAQAQYARQHKTIWEQATADIKGYAGSFVGVAAAVEVVRRSINEFAQFERGMARIEMQTGATSRQMAHLGHSVDALARETGQSVAELQKSFQTFSAEMGSGGDDVIKMFEEVQKAAHAAGTSFDVMSRTAVTAVKTMNVPMGEVKGMLDVIVKDIPASAMQAWDNVAPRILGIMRNLGSTGKEAVGQAAAAFGHLSTAMGSSQQAGAVFEQMFRKATNTGDIFGKIMVPQMIALQGQTGAATKQLEAMYQQMRVMGVYDENPEKALYMQQRFGFSEESVRGMEKAHDNFVKITAEVEKTGEAFDVVEKRLLRLNRGPMAAVDDLKGSLGELWTTIGSVFGGAIPQQLANMVTGLKNDIERVQAAFAWIRRNVTHAEDDQGKPIESTADRIRLGNPGGRGAIGDWMFRERPQPQVTPPPTVGGRRTGRYQGGGFATGGEFTVEGQGGRDTEPVGFMATPGERVAVTTPMQESLQVQQDKADIAMREHFARFRDRGTKTSPAPWWPGSTVRAPGAGGPLSGGGGGGGGIPGGQAGAYGGPGGGGGTSGTSGGADPPGTGTTPLKTPVGTDPASDTGPAEDIETAVKRGYLTQTGGGAGSNSSLAGQRARFAEEIKNNPALREKILRISAGENLHGDANTAVFESAMNRAAMMNTSLAFEMRRTNEGGYYAGYKDNLSAADRKIAEAGLARALGGSNVSNYATENASGSWGEKRMSGGQFTKVSQYGVKGNVELFGIPTGPGARGYDRYAAWKAKSQAGTITTEGTPAGTTVGTASSVQAAVRAGQSMDAAGNVQEGGPQGEVRLGEKGAHGYSRGGVQTESWLIDTVRQASKALPEGYRAEVISTVDPRDTGTKWHPSGRAIDIQIYDKEGNKVKNVGMKEGSKEYAVYENMALAARQYANQKYPDKTFVWGGHFNSGTPYDLMHFQSGGVAARGFTKEQLTKAVIGPPPTKVAGPAAISDVETRAAARYAAAVERNKPATAQTNTAATTSQPAAGQKTDDQLDRASGKPGSRVPPAPVRRMPNPPGQEDRAAGKGRPAAAAAAAPATVPHPVSPQADPIPAGKQWGGDVRAGRAYTVGEGGPETFIPNSPGRIDPGGMNVGSMAAEYQQFAEMLRTPIRPQIEMPRAGPIRQRMSRHVEAQRERDVGRMSRHAAHSDIGFA